MSTARSRSPSSSTKPSSCAFVAQYTSPVAMRRTASSSILRAVATMDTKELNESSISACIFASSSGVASRQKAPMSLYAPLLLTLTPTPMRRSSSCSAGRADMTPIEPTMAAWLATILWAAQQI